MKYERWTSLLQRDPVEQGTPLPVHDVLFVGEPVLCYDDIHLQTGYDQVEIMPAFLANTRVWVQRRTWCPEYGYSASGIQESIVEYLDGVQTLIDHDIYTVKDDRDVI